MSVDRARILNEISKPGANEWGILAKALGLTNENCRVALPLLEVFMIQHENAGNFKMRQKNHVI